MAAADQAAAASGIPTSGLMERAGRAVGLAAIQMLGGTYGRRVVVLCGKGNNAGDGFIAAGYLARRGARCAVILCGDPAQLNGDALDAYRRLEGSGVRVTRYEPARTQAALERADLLVDALLGTGFSGELRDPISGMVAAANAAGAPVLAVDVPSGVDADSGQVAGEAVRAARTVTLAALKVGLLVPPGSGYAGRVEVADIGIPDRLMPTGLHLAGAADLSTVLAGREVTAHKRSSGKVAVAAGSLGMSGAAVLCAAGALRSGAGLVRILVPGALRAEVAPQVMEALTTGVPGARGDVFGPESTGLVLEQAARMQVLALGPGIGKDSGTMDFVTEVLERAVLPLVLDADGLSALAGSPEALRSRPAPTVLTPHAGELSRLLGCSAGEVDAGRVAAARETAERSGAVVLLKGYRTVVAAPDGRAVMVDAGGPVLATAGTGDVLTGVVAALACRTEPFTAAWAGALLHGLAGDTLAEWMGPQGPVASDLLKVLPLVIGRAAP